MAGSLVLIMIHGVTGGRWGPYLAPVLVPLARALPFQALLFLPLLPFADLVFPWAFEPRPEIGGAVARYYLNIPSFVIRSVLVLVIWCVLSILFAWRPGVTPLSAAFGLIVYAITATLAAIDWAMSIEPRFSSTAFGAAFAVAQILGALAVAGIWFCRRTRSGGTSDHGGLLLATLLGFAYLQFMQFLVIWAGGLPEKMAWYVLRASGPWNEMIVAAIVVGLVIPFVLLLPTRLRNRARTLGLASGLVLVGLILFWRWQMADLHPAQPFGVSDIAGLAGFGALLSGWTLRQFWMKRGGRRDE